MTYQQAMLATSRNLNIRGTITFPDLSVVSLTNAHIVTYCINEGGSTIPLGGIASSSFLLELANSNGEWFKGGSIVGIRNITGAEVFIEIAVFHDGAYDYKPAGKWYVHKPIGQEGNTRYSLRGYDKLFTSYDDVFNDTLTYSAATTLQNVLDHILSKGVTLTGSLACNASAIISAKPDWGDNCSLRKALGFVAAAGGCYLSVDRSGDLKLVSVKNATAAKPLTTNEYIDLDNQNAYFGFNRIKVMPRGATSETTYTEGVVNAGIPEAANNTLVMTDNPIFARDAANLQTMVTALATALSGYSLDLMTVRWRGDPTFVLGERVQLTDRRGGVMTTPILQQTIKFDAGLNSTISCVVSLEHMLPSFISPNGTLSPAAFGKGSLDPSTLIAHSITSDYIASGAISANEIAADAVTSHKIAADAILAEHIGANEVITDYANIGDAIITSAKIGNGEIQRANIGFAAVGSAEIQDLSVVGAKIYQGEIESLKVQSANIANAAIKSAHIDTGVVGTAQIADGSITDAKIVDLTANKITAGTLNAANIDVINLNAESLTVGKINGQQIAPGAIDTENLAAEAVGTNEIKPSAITAELIAADAITAEKIVASAITTNKIAAAAVTANELAANSVNAAKIQADAITAEKIKAGEINTNHLSPAFGEQLVISANPAISAVSDAVAAEKARAEAVEGELQDFTDKANAFFIFDLVEGSMTIGMVGSPFASKYSTTKQAFLQSGVEVAYLSNNKLYITNAEIIDVLTVGNPTDGYVDIDTKDGGQRASWRAN